MRALRNLKSRHPAAFGAGLGIFLAASAAVAGFIVYSGVDGTSNGNFQISSTLSAITLSGNESAAIGPGSTTTLPVLLTNNDASAAHTVQSPVATFTTTPAVCASHLSVTGLGAVNGQTVAAGGTTAINIGVSIVADATLPSTCASGTFSIAWSGSTS